MTAASHIAELRLQAQYADDFTQYRREMAEADRLERQLGLTKATPRTNPEPAQRRPTGRLVATSIAHALELMEGKLTA